MNLKSTFKIRKTAAEISFDDKMFFIGSCFSENISERLQERKFECLSNPFGIIYNPISIFKNLDFIINQRRFTEADLFCHQEIYSSFDFHSDMSGLSVEDVLNNIHLNLEKSYHFLQQAKTIFITFGTAWIYETKDNKLVANCHKLPNDTFKKRCLSVKEINEKAQETIAMLKRFNPELEIIFTLSPVRHLKDGFVENNLSKSILNIAIQELVSETSSCNYFPAYELIIDDLRDYRFFKEDLVHPNKLAIDYVFEAFKNSYFNEATIQKLNEVEKILNMLNHRVNFKNTTPYKQFVVQALTKIETLEAQGFDFRKEKNRFLN